MKRTARTGGPLAVEPLLVSDQSAPAVVGLDPRAFRELVRKNKIPHVVAGHRMLVRARDLVALVVRGEPVSASEPPDDDDLSADEILARSGYRRRA